MCDLLDLCNEIDEVKGMEPTKESHPFLNDNIVSLDRDLCLDEKKLSLMEVSIMQNMGKKQYEEVTENFYHNLKTKKVLGETDKIKREKSSIENKEV